MLKRFQDLKNSKWKMIWTNTKMFSVFIGSQNRYLGFTKKLKKSVEKYYHVDKGLTEIKTRKLNNKKETNTFY